MRCSSLMVHESVGVQDVFEETCAIQLCIRALETVSALVCVDTQLAQEGPHDSLGEILWRHGFDVLFVVGQIGAEQLSRLACWRTRRRWSGCWRCVFSCFQSEVLGELVCECGWSPSRRVVDVVGGIGNVQSLVQLEFVR